MSREIKIIIRSWKRKGILLLHGQAMVSSSAKCIYEVTIYLNFKKTASPLAVSLQGRNFSNSERTLIGIWAAIFMCNESIVLLRYPSKLWSVIKRSKTFLVANITKHVNHRKIAAFNLLKMQHDQFYVCFRIMKRRYRTSFVVNYLCNISSSDQH